MKARIVYGNPIRYYLDDREVTEEQFRSETPDRLQDALDAGETACGQATTTWPQESEALSVLPKQVEAANARNKKHGIAVHYKADGTAVVTSANAKRQLMRLEGFHDKRAFN